MSRTTRQEASWTRLSASTRATRVPASRDTFETLSYCFGTISCHEIMSETPGGGVLPYMGYIGMCGPKGYGFSAVLVINRVAILADFGHK